MRDFRPKPFYFIDTADPAELTPDACRRAMAALAAAGYGGCVLFNKPPTGFDPKQYLSDFWFETLENFIVAGRDLGLEMWVNDGFDYPPGDAAGRIAARDPGLRQQRLRLAADGGVEVVETPWGFPAFELPESSELFIELVYEAHRTRLGKYFGNGLCGFFSDCDNRRVNAFNLKALENGRYFPWSRDFAAGFRRRFGYDVTPRLPAILRGRDPDAQADYWRYAGELYQKWFANNYAWCRAHGLKYTFHTSDTGPLPVSECRRSSLASEGDPLELLAHSDFPGTDHELALLDGGTHYDARYRIPTKIWGTPGRAGYENFAATRSDVRAKLAASAAFLYDSDGVMCEMFAATNFGTDFQELRRIALWQVMMGVNFIVPHAVHHRFFGSVKYFAPPEFLHGTLRTGLEEFNAMLTDACRIASEGRYCAAVALLSPVEAIWRGDDAASGRFLDLCDRLNRSAVGYVIVTPGYLSAHRDEFARVIDPVTWDGNLSLAELPGGDVRFDGGELGFMRRRRDDGTEFLIACNLWSDRELTGSLHWGGREYVLALAPGEYAVLGGAEERFRTPLAAETVAELPTEADAAFSAPQRIPLECPNRVDGETREFVWENCAAVGSLALEYPAEFRGTILCDGVPLGAGREIAVFDDRYREIELPPDASACGAHRLVWTGSMPPTCPARLRGDVEVSLIADGKGEAVLSTYNLTVLRPLRHRMILAPRRRRLRLGELLGAQGEVFYDGDATLTWRFTLPAAASGIDLPGTCGVCDIELDGRPPVRCIAEPYRVMLDIPAGEHELNLTLHGSLGALMEGGNSAVALPDAIRFFSQPRL